MNVCRKIGSYTKALGLSMLIGLNSCGHKINNSTAHVNIDTISCSTKKLIFMLERGDKHAIRLTGVPKNTKVLKSEDIYKYLPSQEKGDLYYRVYAGKADKAIRSANGEEGTLLTVGSGYTGLNCINLSNAQKAYEGDYISESLADSLTNVAINQKDSILRANIPDSAYNKLQKYEKDAIIAYLYNVKESLLQKAPKGKSFYENLSEGNMGVVQSKFNVMPSSDVAKAGLAKRNLIQLLIFGNGKVYSDKISKDNFEKQISIVKGHRRGNKILEDVINIVQKYGVDSLNLSKSKEMMLNK